MRGRARIGLEATTQSRDEVIHRSSVAVVSKLPNTLEQLGAAEHASGIFGKVSKQIELELRELHGLPADVYLVCIEVDLCFAE